MSAVEGTLDPFAGLATGDIDGHGRAAENVVEPVEKDGRSTLDKLEARRKEMREQGAKLLCPIPSWGTELIGEFTKLDKAEGKRFGAAVEKAPPGVGKEGQARRSMCLRIAMQCRAVRFNDEQIEGDTAFGGFTAAFGERLGATPIEGGTRPVDSADIVWAAVDRDDENLMALTRELTRWSKNPVFKDLSDADPFGGF